MNKILIIYKGADLIQLAYINDKTKLNVNKEFKSEQVETIDEALQFMNDNEINYAD